MIETRSRDEIRQYQNDRRSWEDRLRRLEDEKALELQQIEARYAGREPHSFPVAVVFVVPKSEAV